MSQEQSTTTNTLVNQLDATHMGAHYSRYVNANLVEYHVPVNTDNPRHG